MITDVHKPVCGGRACHTGRRNRAPCALRRYTYGALARRGVAKATRSRTLQGHPIFFATMQKPSKDNSGDKIYVKDPVTGENVLDHHGHLIVDHDLYSHDGLTPDGIAEAFIEFAKKEGLSFFQ